jgi:hypothetical protein
VPNAGGSPAGSCVWARVFETDTAPSRLNEAVAKNFRRDLRMVLLRATKLDFFA